MRVLGRDAVGVDGALELVRILAAVLVDRHGVEHLDALEGIGQLQPRQKIIQKAQIKLRVVRHDQGVRVRDGRSELRRRLPFFHAPLRQHLRRNAGQLRDHGRERPALGQADEHVHLRLDAAGRDAGGGQLDDLVLFAVNARRLGVEDNDAFKFFKQGIQHILTSCGYSTGKCGKKQERRGTARQNAHRRRTEPFAAPVNCPSAMAGTPPTNT